MNQYTWIVKLVENQCRLTLAKNPRRKDSVPYPLTVKNLKILPVGIVLSCDYFLIDLSLKKAETMIKAFKSIHFHSK
jgi:hypothetical protein